jgi:membrane protease YdiL (CAAX protease family)
LSLGWPRDWRWNGSARAWWLAGLVVLVAIAVGTIAHGGNVPLRKPGAGPVLRYFAWALLQQYLVCVVCTRRWQQISGNACVAAVLGALGFALMHSPNADLMFATFLGGLCWCALYLRERALLPLAASHALCALILIALTPPQWLYSAEVSARFFQ